LLPIESTYLVCLVNTYAVRGRTKVLRGGSRPAERPRSLEGTLFVRIYIHHSFKVTEDKVGL